MKKVMAGGNADVAIVSGAKGYNAWPMAVAIRDRVLCVYSVGDRHDPGDPAQNVYCRASFDQGKTWAEEVLVTARREYGETVTGKGINENGDALFWVRSFIQNTPERHHELFRTSDGRKFEKVSAPKLNPEPMQITDIVALSGGGLAAMWFETGYQPGRKDGSWGLLVSGDNGKTWSQTVVESGLLPGEVPQEQAMIELGGGRFAMLSRLNDGKAQTLFYSADNKITWRQFATNLDDLYNNTPTMYFDRASQMVTCCYYQRNLGRLLRRTIPADDLPERADHWSAPEEIACGSKCNCDAGNANMTQSGTKQLVVFYSGKTPDTSIFCAVADAPNA
ncbi:MAG: sialidase family protein [Victivallaceae bacterium]|nr:sialidase family protein [Victivallaceae bacterium]